jgi:hypothetical protein
MIKKIGALVGLTVLLNGCVSPLDGKLRLPIKDKRIKSSYYLKDNTLEAEIIASYPYLKNDELRGDIESATPLSMNNRSYYGNSQTIITVPGTEMKTGFYILNGELAIRYSFEAPLNVINATEGHKFLQFYYRDKPIYGFRIE